jgi:hypothetical protein
MKALRPSRLEIVEHLIRMRGFLDGILIPPSSRGAQRSGASKDA